MPIAPFLQPLVEIRHQLEQHGHFPLLPIEPDEALLEDVVGDGGQPDVSRRQIGGDGHSSLPEKPVPVMDQRGLIHPPLESRQHLGLVAVELEELRALVPQHELELTELPGLEA